MLLRSLEPQTSITWFSLLIEYWTSNLKRRTSNPRDLTSCWHFGHSGCWTLDVGCWMLDVECKQDIAQYAGSYRGRCIGQPMNSNVNARFLPGIPRIWTLSCDLKSRIQAEWETNVRWLKPQISIHSVISRHLLISWCGTGLGRDGGFLFMGAGGEGGREGPLDVEDVMFKDVKLCPV